MKLPNEVNILGIPYKITYVDRMVDVDFEKNRSKYYWGMVDYDSRTIRVYSKDRPYEEIMRTVWHEILEAIGAMLHVNVWYDHEGNWKDQGHRDLDRIALGINAVLLQNGWLK
jgi:hypothetical protein